MSRYLLFFFLCISIVLFSCHSNMADVNDSDNPSKDIVASNVVKYAKAFSIEKHVNFKILRTYNSLNSKDSLHCYVLYLKGTVKPELMEKAIYIETPVSRVASLSSFYTGCLEKLNLLPQLLAIDNANYLTDENILNAVKEKKIIELNKTNELNLEQTLLVNPDLMFTYGMGSSENNNYNKLSAAGIPIVLCFEHTEKTALACAEWLKFVACFFNEEAKADTLFSSIEKNYLKLNTLTSGIKNKPSVLTELKYGDTWYVPSGKSCIAHLLNDAGANYIWSNREENGNIPLSFEEVYSKAANADYWLNLHLSNNKTDLVKQDQRYSSFKAYKNGNLFNNNASCTNKGGNAYWEKGLINCDELLADLIYIFHSELIPNHRLKYYKKLNSF